MAKQQKQQHPAVDDLLSLIELTYADQTYHQDLYEQVSQALARSTTVSEALARIGTPSTRRTLHDCAAAVASHTEVRRGAGRTLAAFFAIPFTAIIAPGPGGRTPLILSCRDQVLALLRECNVIQGARQLYLSDVIIGRDEVGELSMEQRHAATERLVGQVVRDQGEAGFPPHELDLDENEGAVFSFYIAGVALGTQTTRPRFYDAGDSECLAWCTRFGALMQDELRRLGFEALVQALPPDLFYYAVDTGYYRSKLAGLEIQLSLQLMMHQLEGEMAVAIVSAHTDQRIRITINDRVLRQPRFIFEWDLMPHEDLEESLEDITRVISECGIHDVHVMPGLQYHTGASPGFLPTLDDLEHRDNTLQ